eukprot:5113113-Pleurochrysis_carterae.AAC.1
MCIRDRWGGGEPSWPRPSPNKDGLLNVKTDRQTRTARAQRPVLRRSRRFSGTNLRFAHNSL